MPAAFAVGPGYPLRFSEGGLGFVTRPLWMGEEDPVVSCGEGGDQFFFFLAIYDRWLWSRSFFSPNSFLSTSSFCNLNCDGLFFAPVFEHARHCAGEGENCSVVQSLLHVRHCLFIAVANALNHYPFL